VIVVDTNILAYRFIPGPRTDEARQLAGKEPFWSAPPLWRFELHNVLAGYLRRQAFDRALAREIMLNAAKALSRDDRRIESGLVFDLVLRSRCTSYDCEFVAWALNLRVPLITEDAALLRNFPGACLSLSQALAA